MLETHPNRDKRGLLVQAATRLLHEQGFQRTTLADIATRARVPLGNVYYYFKTKEALAEAVIDAHVAGLEEGFAMLTAREPSPTERLRAVVLAPLSNRDAVIRFGCPHGSLCQELDKLGPDAPLAKAAASLFETHLGFAATQYRALGFTRAQARDEAADLIAAIQGAMLLGHTLRSGDHLARQLRRISRRLDEAPPRPRKGRSS